MTFKLALLQFEVKPGDTAGNMSRMKSGISEAAAHGADAFILPELFNCGYVADSSAFAETTKGRTVAALGKLCAKDSLAMLGGSIIEKRDGRLYNTSLFIDATGMTKAKYRKVHLFDGEIRESELFSAGDEWVSCRFDDMEIGMLTCFDLRFPVFARNLALRGAKALALCAQWPLARLEAWRSLLQSRAIENEIWVFACNACGEGAFRCGGHSLIIAPDGSIVAEAGEGSEIVYADINTARCGAFNILELRRPILDEIDESQL